MKKKIAKVQKASTFAGAVAAAKDASVAGAHRPGKQALGNHSDRVVFAAPHRITRSIDLDSTLASDPSHAQSNRWDYGLGYKGPSAKSRELAVWVEVHSANTSEVHTMINKKNWLRDYLIGQCDALWKLSVRQSGEDGVPVFVWVASNGVHISKNSSQARALASSGIAWPTRVLHLA